MARLKGIFFDTSILVAGMIDLGPSSEAPLTLMDAVAAQQIDQPLTAWHCCLEFFAVTTRLPEEYRLAPEIALRFLREEVLGRFKVHDLNAGDRSRFLTTAVAEGSRGGRIYDAHIGEIARHAGAKIVITDNRRHFTHLLHHDIQVLVSSEAVKELRL